MNAQNIIIGLQTLCKYLKPEHQMFGSYTGKYLEALYSLDAQPYKMSMEDLSLIEKLGWRYKNDSWKLEIYQ